MGTDMKNEFVTYKQAIALKELGFDEDCFGYYTVIPEDEINWFTIPEQGITDKTSFGSSKNYNSKSFEEEGTISAPTFSQAFRWFRDKQGLHSIYTMGDDWNNYYWQVWKNDTMTKTYVCSSDYVYETYEEAEQTCLDKLIEIVKKTK